MKNIKEEYENLDKDIFSLIEFHSDKIPDNSIADQLIRRGIHILMSSYFFNKDYVDIRDLIELLIDNHMNDYKNTHK